MTGSTRVRKMLWLALLAVLGGAWFLALPPRAASVGLPATPAARGVRGAIHIHTTRSDGTGTVDEIAAAAARAGLQFVIFTDHGDATREADPPQYRDGVLCIDAVEISTRDGHVLALGLPQSPYPLGGEARDVVEDIVRMGGFPIAAHPGSLKSELQWSDWTLPVGGLEWLNADSEWRDESGWTLMKALLTYPARRTETLAGLLDRPDDVLRRWDALTGERQTVAIAAADAHARIGFRTVGEPYDNGSSLHVPSYEQLFRTFSNVVPGMSLTGDPAADADALIDAIRKGRAYTAIDGMGSGGALSFTATDGDMRGEPGDVVSILREWTLSVEVDGSPDALIQLFRDGVRTNESLTRLKHVTEIGGRGAYRVEVLLPGAPGQPPVPWLLSNPIYVGEPRPSTVEAPVPITNVELKYGDGPATGWSMETSPASKAAMDVVAAERGTQLALRYAVGGMASAGPYAAFAMPAGQSLPQYDRLIFTARADRPTRFSVQLREPVNGRRWHRSVFVGTEPREVTIRFDDLRPIATADAQPALADVDSVLFVFDTVNTPLGGNGRLWIDEVRYAR